MLDLIMLAMGLAFFALSVGYAVACDPHSSPHFLHDGIVCERGGCDRWRSFISAVLARGAPPRTTPAPFGQKSRPPSADPPHPPGPGTAPIPLTSLHFQNEGILDFQNEGI